MITKREWVFETNSSSMHSFTTYDSPELLVWNPDENWDISIYFWEYGWWYEKYSWPEHIASYIATSLFQSCSKGDLNDEWEYIWENEKILNFERIIKDQTWAKRIIYYMCPYYSTFWYIDHQSSDFAEDMYNDCFKSIFWWWKLIIDNDNH